MFQFGLRSGHIGSVRVSDGEVDRLWENVQNAGGAKRFVVFDTRRRRIALNLDHLTWSRFGGGPLKTTIVADGTGTTVDLLLVGDAQIWRLEAQADECSLIDTLVGQAGDIQPAQIANLFFHLDIARRGSDYAQPLVNADGATTWLRLSDVAFFSAPLAMIVPVTE